MFLPPAMDSSRLEAGCDEAGRGCLAGPVYAAAVILPPDYRHDWLNDSKQLTSARRDLLRGEIEQHAIAWAVAKLSPKEIDRYNILRSSILAMHRAIRRLPITPEHILVDGNRFIPYKGIDHTCVVKGDATYANIAAASILAKTYRDDYMRYMHMKYPMYNWLSNKGYPTKEHRAAIANHGISKIHRRTFKMLPDNEQSTLLKGPHRK